MPVLLSIICLFSRLLSNIRRGSDHPRFQLCRCIRHYFSPECKLHCLYQLKPPHGSNSDIGKPVYGFRAIQNSA